jgi:hypothetical protein
MRVPFGGLLPAPTSQSCRLFNACVFALLYGEPWYMTNLQIHEDLGVPHFADHIRVLTESFDYKLAGLGNPLVEQLGRHLR